MSNYNMEWDNICRVCLQEGVMRQIFDENEEESVISHRITLCSSIIVSILKMWIRLWPKIIIKVLKSIG